MKDCLYRLGSVARIRARPLTRLVAGWNSPSIRWGAACLAGRAPPVAGICPRPLHSCAAVEGRSAGSERSYRIQQAVS